MDCLIHDKLSHEYINTRGSGVLLIAPGRSLEA